MHPHTHPPTHYDHWHLVYAWSTVVSLYQFCSHVGNLINACSQKRVSFLRLPDIASIPFYLPTLRLLSLFLLMLLTLPLLLNKHWPLGCFTSRCFTICKWPKILALGLYSQSDRHMFCRPLAHTITRVRWHYSKLSPWNNIFLFLHKHFWLFWYFPMSIFAIWFPLSKWYSTIFLAQIPILSRGSPEYSTIILTICNISLSFSFPHFFLIFNFL